MGTRAWLRTRLHLKFTGNAWRGGGDGGGARLGRITQTHPVGLRSDSQHTGKVVFTCETRFVLMQPKAPA